MNELEETADTREKAIFMETVDQAVKNHIEMNTSGALLITGDWGSGKTYYLKNHLFPRIEKEKGYSTILVSIYGVTAKEEIAKKVLLAYFDKKGGNSILNTSNIVGGLEKLGKSLPIIKKYVDLEQLITGSGENILGLINPDKLLIAFDDLERISQEIKLSDFLGTINELVENKGWKVLIIANETEIKNGIKFKEKTIEKTVHFEPKLTEIFESILTKYQNQEFLEFIQSEKQFILESLDYRYHSKTNDRELTKHLYDKLKKELANIRTIKFALEHFHHVFQELYNTNDNQLSQKLRNVWLFILGISIAHKAKKGITFDVRKDLDSQSSLFDFDPSQLRLLSPTEMSEDKKLSFSEKFKAKFYHRLNQPFHFYEEIYALITTGRNLDKAGLDQRLNEAFNIQNGKVNPGHEIVGQFMLKGFWQLSNEEFAESLKKLFKYVKEGTLTDLVTYLNAGVYLIGFDSILGKSKQAIEDALKEGVSIFLDNIEVNYLARSQFEMVVGNFKDPHLMNVIAHIEETIKSNESKAAQAKVDRMEELLSKSFSSFVEMMMDTSDGMMKHFNEPILAKVNFNNVTIVISDNQPKDIVNLSSFFGKRYLESHYTEQLKLERDFLENLLKKINENDLTEANLTNSLASTRLVPNIEKSIEKLK